MIFRASLIREFTQTGLLVGAVLTAILLVTQVVRLLGLAAGGALAPDTVLAMLGFGAINYLSIALSLTLFISVLSTISRCYSDSEMVVWFSTGIGIFDFVRPVLYFALPFAAIVAVLSLYLSPWSIRKAAEFQARVESRSEISQVTPGVFVESKQADRVFFVDALSGDDRTLSNVFVQSLQNQRLGVMVAARGHQETAANGDKFIVLEDGRRYEGTPGQADYKMVDFTSYAMRIESKEGKSREGSPKSLDLKDLVVGNPSPENMGEFHWRIGLPVSVVVLALLAVPLGYVNPRAGRSANVVLAILTYTIYNNMMSIAQAWVVQGKIPGWIGLWPVHAAFAFVALLLLLRRAENLRLHAWRRRFMGRG